MPRKTQSPATIARHLKAIYERVSGHGVNGRPHKYDGGSDITTTAQDAALLAAYKHESDRWFYAPCPSCGAIEGMGLSTPRENGKLMRGHTAVWCPWCEHAGPAVETNPKDVTASDRAAVVGWNRQFKERFAALSMLDARLTEGK